LIRIYGGEASDGRIERLPKDTRRAEGAGLDPDMVFERWNKTAKVAYDRRVQSELCSLHFIEEKRNVVVPHDAGDR
jgi:hypothetical protein